MNQSLTNTFLRLLNKTIASVFKAFVLVVSQGFDWQIANRVTAPGKFGFNVTDFEVGVFNNRTSACLINGTLEYSVGYSFRVYGYMKFNTGSKAKQDRPLQGQSPYIVNIGLTYDNPENGWFGSAVFNRVGRRIAYVGCCARIC